MESKIENLNNIGQAYYNIGDFGTALKSFSEAVECSRKIGAEKYTALNLWWMAISYRDSGKPEEAIKIAEDALVLYRRLGLSNEATKVEELILTKGKSMLIELEKDLEEENRNRNRNQKRLSMYLTDKYNIFSLVEKYQFIRDDVFLAAVGSDITFNLHLEFHKINPATGGSEVFDELQCIHTVLMRMPYDKYAELMEDPEKLQKFEDDVYQMDVEYEDKNYENFDYPEDADGTEYCLTFEQEFFAFKSWVQGIAEAGLDALKIQSEIDSLTHALPIAQFIAKNLIRVDPSYLMEFLNNIEKECRFEGQYHLPSLRANLIIALEAISNMDLFDEMHFDNYSDFDYKKHFYNSDERKFDSYYRLQFWQGDEPYYAPIDEKAKNQIIDSLRFIWELDSDFLKHYENKRIVRFCTANYIF